jgi:signal transduction histidine kinase
VTTTPEARFLAVISHELRTPLTAIASFTESLDTDDLAPGERSQAVSAVRRNTERMLALVDDLLLVSRLRNGSSMPCSARWRARRRTGRWRSATRRERTTGG